MKDIKTTSFAASQDRLHAAAVHRALRGTLHVKIANRQLPGEDVQSGRLGALRGVDRYRNGGED